MATSNQDALLIKLTVVVRAAPAAALLAQNTGLAWGATPLANSLTTSTALEVGTRTSGYVCKHTVTNTSAAFLVDVQLQASLPAPQMWSDNYITPPSQGGWNNWAAGQPANTINWLDSLAYADASASKPGKWYVSSMWADTNGLACGGGSYPSGYYHMVCRQRREWLSDRVLSDVTRGAVQAMQCHALHHQISHAPPAGPLSFYKPQYMSVSKSGCQPANTSNWVSFGGDWWMYRLIKIGYNWATHTQQAKDVYGGYLWAPYTRKEQVSAASPGCVSWPCPDSAVCQLL
jgi:hypothetical protein